MGSQCSPWGAKIVLPPLRGGKRTCPGAGLQFPLPLPPCANITATAITRCGTATATATSARSPQRRQGRRAACAVATFPPALLPCNHIECARACGASLHTTHDWSERPQLVTCMAPYCAPSSAEQVCTSASHRPRLVATHAFAPFAARRCGAKPCARVFR